ncbi:MAG: hypothetical protein HQ591_04755 [candidate division Zixibacteria bacterium]|nr:hypothetical protein [Candidatus Tariuqbacter arcticus]
MAASNRYVRTLTIFSILMLFSSSTMARDLKKIPINRLLRMPTAEMLETGQASYELSFLPEGDAIGAVRLGLYSKITIGVSFGVKDLLSYDEVKFYQNPGYIFKYSICPETHKKPALAIGIDTQGWGYNEINPASGERRYLYKAPGLFLLIAKNYSPLCLKNFGFNAVVNYNPFEAEDDEDINIMLGMNKTVWWWLSLITEYDFAFNDNHQDAYNEGNGYVNLAFRFQPIDQFFVDIVALDAIGNSKSADSETQLIRFVLRIP